MRSLGLVTNRAAVELNSATSAIEAGQPLAISARTGWEVVCGEPLTE